jgi:serine/threonine protein kinase
MNELNLKMKSGCVENLADKYYYRQRIGGGTFGDVWEVYNYADNKIYAAKDEFIKKQKRGDSGNIEIIKPSMVEKESKIYLELESGGFGAGLPKYCEFIPTTVKNVLIIERLGISLEGLYKNQGKIFSNNQLRSYGLQMIHLIEKLHSFGYIHRDVKPQNFIFSTDNFLQLFICDFGLTKKYIKNGEHVPEENNKQLVGTMRYTSTFIHDGTEPSRRDDIISVLYIIIHSKNKYLPWQSKNKKKLNKNEIGKIKKKISIDCLCGELKEIAYALNYCYSLKFSQKPDYEYVKLKIKNQFV